MTGTHQETTRALVRDANVMSVAYVLDCFPELSETFVLNEIRALTALGSRVTIVARRRPSDAGPVHREAERFIDGCLYCPAGSFIRFSRVLEALLLRGHRSWWALALCLRLFFCSPRGGFLGAFADACSVRSQIDRDVGVVHAHFAYTAATGAALARLLDRPFSFTGHAVDIFVSTKPRVLAALVSEARLVLATSETGRSKLVEIAAPGDRDKVVLLRNGIDRELFRLRAAEPSGVPEVVSVCRLVEKKGIDTLLRALSVLRERRVVYRGTIVGEGPLRVSLEDLARDLGLAGVVEFRAAVEQRQVVQTLQGASVFALPCRQLGDGDRDGVPNVLLEAMAVGVPVVAAAAGGVGEVVVDGRSGLLVPPDSPAQLATAIGRVIHDSALRGRIVAGGLGATADYDIDRAGRTLMCHLRRISATAGRDAWLAD
ncbi:MAG TPA: glycosyltransferase [Gaiellaceae bacterium]|nr:glycosyltransferase [Gaiellaceae bacterium]